MVREILCLGDPRLYRSSAPVTEDDLPTLAPVVSDLHDTLFHFRERYGAGRAVAAPQIGVFKRLIYMHVTEPLVIFNPALSFPDSEMITLMDDCMSFPGLYVRVRRYRRCTLHYRDRGFQPRVLELEGDLSELIQHEYDHLDGILATMRRVDDRAFSILDPKKA